jgi:hypothetical protein
MLAITRKEHHDATSRIKGTPKNQRRLASLARIASLSRRSAPLCARRGRAATARPAPLKLLALALPRHDLEA